MKPLTIEQLKALEVGDWVYVIDLKRKNYAAYVQKDTKATDKFNQLTWTLFYCYYGKQWFAYKNKEQAECKGDRFTCEDSTYYEKSIARLQELENKMATGEIVELPCIIPITNSKGVEVIFQLVYREDSTNILRVKNYIGNNKSAAEAKLAELNSK